MKRFLASWGILGLLGACSTYPAPETPAWPHPDEAEFLLYCDEPGDGLWDVQGETPTCDAPFHVEWESLPLKVWSEDQYLDETLEAVDAWNHWLGIEAFTVASDEESADVLVFDVSSDIFTAQALHGTWNGRHQAAVVVGMPRSFTGSVAAHELGHVLGLAHDHDNPWSIMSYRHWTWIDDVDRRALLRKYGE